MQIHTLWPFRTICRSKHYMTISYHMQIDTLYDHFVPYADRYIIWPFRTICRLTHMTISNHIKIYIMTISYHMQIDTIDDHFVPYADWHIWPFRTILKNTLWPFRTICRSTHCDHFVSYADRYIITISYHMQIDTLWPFRTVCKILWRWYIYPYFTS
jgi:hypothetical protein